VTGVLKKLASLRLTLVGMLLLAVLAVVGSRNPEIGTGITIWPIALLTFNLLAALLTNKVFRTQTGLLVFHVGLLLIFACIGLTVLTNYEGRVEVVQGGPFDASQVTTMKQGWWHSPRLDDVSFLQDEIQVNYLHNFIRLDTSSTIHYRTATGELRAVTTGDQRRANIEGYEISATSNKGFAVLLRWMDANGRVELGSVHFPSYPSFDWKQVATWTTSAGQLLELELELLEPVADISNPWTLGRTDIPFVLQVRSTDSAMAPARIGESVALDGGTVRVEDLRMWMAYRISYLPYLSWMFVAAMLAIIGLAIHFGGRYLSPAGSINNSRVIEAGANVARV
jgi:cytochrome c biogenesis protein